MPSAYHEILPSPTLAPFVECFWTGEVTKNEQARILPDGCADILFFFRKKELTDAQVVGVMTHAHLDPLTAGTSLLGIRFHPGMAGACLPGDIRKLNDRSVPIQSVCPAAADSLLPLMRGNSSTESRIAALEDRLVDLPRINFVQKAIGELVGRRGQFSVNDFAAVAGTGERQLRRTCLKHSGLSPKQLARILRFRHALTRLRRGERDMPKLALHCGYYDQPHMIRDFRELAGMSPLRYLAREEEEEGGVTDFSNTAGGVMHLNCCEMICTQN